MTWIVGYNTIFGYSFLVSDIQITVTTDSGEQYFDCCQKIYNLTDVIGGGFAGSVKIGFEMMASLHTIFRNKPPGTAWCLDEISESWLPDFLKQIYENQSDEEKAAGCQIILASAHPQKHRGVATFPLSQIATYTAPDFAPNISDNLGLLSIGSGSQYYESALIELAQNREIMQAAMAGAGGYGRAVINWIEHIFKDNPQNGISPYYQLMSIDRSGIFKYDCNKRTYHPDGRIEEHIVPSVCTSYDQLMNFLSTSAAQGIRSVVC